MEIEDALYDHITKLSKEGDALAESGLYDKAIEKYQTALNLVPSPKTNWEAAIWLYAAIGDAYFFAKKFPDALSAFQCAYNCPDGITNPFVNLRIGECYFEQNNLDQAEEYMLRAYMWEGKAIFENEDDKYVQFMAEKYDIT